MHVQVKSQSEILALKEAQGAERAELEEPAAYLQKKQAAYAAALAAALARSAEHAAIMSWGLD
jgi:hypothetical protein